MDKKESFYLSSIKTSQDLLAIAVERWGFYPASIDIVPFDFEEELENSLLEKKVLAEFEGFRIIFFKVKNIDNQKIESHLNKIERQVFKNIPSFQREKNLFVFSDEKGDFWHFVAVEGGGRIKISRFIITPTNRHKLRTICEQLDKLTIKENDNEQTLTSRLKEIFSVQSLSDKFYQEYKEKVFDDLKKFLFNQNKIAGEEKAHRFTQQLLNRIMFLYFLQKKGVFGQNLDFMASFWDAYLHKFYGKNEFYDKWLKVLFFEALNNNFFAKDYFNVDGYPNFNEILFRAPYLNGGLFRKNELDSLIYQIPDEKFKNIFDFLESYNFTIKEDTPYDQNLEINPEVLGNIYEMLVNVSEEKDEKGELGIFYTPKVEIELMIRRSLVKFLFNKTKIEKEKLYYFVFHEKEKEFVPQFSSEEIDKLLEILDSITIVDPACGSGHYLVVAAQILWELKEILYQQKGMAVDKFEEKKKIIENSIFGVDVKEWAVEITKLRLWLDLMVDADIYHFFSTEPLLPSLSFKIRVGDSLVQEIGGFYFSPQGVQEVNRYPEFRPLIIQIKEQKRKFFHNDFIGRVEDEERRIKEQEKDFYKLIIQKKIENLKLKKHQLERPIRQTFEQTSLIKIGTSVKQELLPLKNEKEIKKIDEEIANLKNQLEKISSKANFAFWPIEFAEIFSEKGGFDIVIANPPYVRQENISDPLAYQELNVEEKRVYKQKLQKQIKKDWSFNGRSLISKIDGRADLYVYFYLKGLKLLNEDGVMCFISSNSWLDVGYGGDLQEILLKYVPIVAIYDNQVKRSFKNADVNTIIALLKAPFKKEWDDNLKDNIVRFVNFKKPFEEVIFSDLFLEIEKTNERKITENFKIYPIKQYELYNEGLEKEEGQMYASYVGNKWGGIYLRAPEIFFKILEKGKDKFIKLSKISNIEGYIHDNNTGEKYPKVTFIKTVKNLNSILLSQNKTVLIEYGVKEDGKSRLLSPILFPRTINDRQLIILNDIKAYGKEFYKIIPFSKEQIINIIFQLNSTLGILQRELFGLTNLGEGALKFSIYDLSFFLILKKLIKIEKFKNFIIRNQKEIMEELGFKKCNQDNCHHREHPYEYVKPEEVSFDKIMPDRREIDRIIFEAIGLTKEEQLEVYRTVVELVKNRLLKAKRV